MVKKRTKAELLADIFLKPCDNCNSGWMVATKIDTPQVETPQVEGRIPAVRYECMNCSRWEERGVRIATSKCYPLEECLEKRFEELEARIRELEEEDE